MSVNFVNVTKGIAWPTASIVTIPRHCYNCTAIVLGIAILISGLSSSSSAPTPSEPEWLVNPCSKQPLVRHGRSTADNQLKIFIHKIDNNFSRKIKSLYNPAENKQMKGKCPRINNMLKPIKSADSLTTASQVFYEALLQFAVFIDRLEHIPITTSGEFNFSERTKVFDDAKKNLRLVICEFNDTLSKYDNIKIQPNKPKVPKINMKCLPKSMDASAAHLMDTEFFKKMKKFLRQSKRILKSKKLKKGRKVVNKSEPKSKRTRKLRQ